MKYLMIFFIFCSAVLAQSNINEDTVHFVGQASGFTVGANLITDGTFDNWSSENLLDDWAETSVTANSEISNVGAGNFHSGAGTGACNIWTDNNSPTWIQKVSILTVGKTYRLTFDVWINLGSISIVDGNFSTLYGTGNSNGAKTIFFTAVHTDIAFNRAAAATDVTIDNIEIVEWVGDLNAGGGCTIAGFEAGGSELSDIMGPSGQVLHNESGLSMAEQGGIIDITAGTAWLTTPIVGTLVKCDFSSALGSGVDDGVFEIVAAHPNYIRIDTAYTAGDEAKTVEVWIGGAYPDIATAINDSTLSQDPDGTYRKRYICVNVDHEVDAVTDFVAEGSDATMIEDDGMRGLFAFYDTITVKTAHSSYRVVSDMDKGELYYGGAYAAFHEDESFSEVNPNRKWIELDAKGNTMNILEMNSSNLQIRNFKIYNTATSASNALMHIKDVAQVHNNTFVNCWFGTADLLTVNAGQILGSVFRDCYFDDAILTANLVDVFNSQFKNCIANGGSKAAIFTEASRNHWSGCLFYKGARAMLTVDNLPFFDSCTFAEQTVAALTLDSSASQIVITNCIFSLAAVADYAVEITTGGSISFGSANNIMYSVTGGGVLTDPIVHAQISPNPALPVGTIEKDPMFVNAADGDFRLQANSPGLNAAYGGGSIGWWQPYAITEQDTRARHAGTPIYK